MDRRRKSEAKMSAQGIVRIGVNVPEEHVDLVRRYAEILRIAKREGIEPPQPPAIRFEPMGKSDDSE